MILCTELSSYLHDFLACDSFNDYAPNGLQVQGREEIKTICTAVTASLCAIEEAVRLKADALLVHHGYFWRGEALEIVGLKYQRISTLLNHKVNLFAYHLPLDCHSTLGNNVCLGNLLKIQSMVSHKVGNTNALLWTGVVNHTAESLEASITTILSRKPTSVIIQDKPIKRVAWCTGAAQDFLSEAYALGADAYISGEISERTFYEAKELGIHYFAAGHHATERYGIQALGKHLASQFGLTHQFIDSKNPV